MKKVYIIDEDAGRIFELMKQWYKVAASCQGSWGELLKTEKHNRRLQHLEKVKNHLHKKIYESYPDTRQYGFEVEIIGSNRTIDMCCKKHQRYILIPKNKEKWL